MLRSIVFQKLMDISFDMWNKYFLYFTIFETLDINQYCFTWHCNVFVDCTECPPAGVASEEVNEYLLLNSQGKLMEVVN